MVTKGKTNIFSFQPWKCSDFYLFHQLHSGFNVIRKQPMVPFIPHNPNAAKPNHVKEW